MMIVNNYNNTQPLSMKYTYPEPQESSPMAWGVAGAVGGGALGAILKNTMPVKDAFEMSKTADVDERSSVLESLPAKLKDGVKELGKEVERFEHEATISTTKKNYLHRVIEGLAEEDFNIEKNKAELLAEVDEEKQISTGKTKKLCEKIELFLGSKLTELENELKAEGADENAVKLKFIQLFSNEAEALAVESENNSSNVVLKNTQLQYQTQAIAEMPKKTNVDTDFAKLREQAQEFLGKEIKEVPEELKGLEFSKSKEEALAILNETQKRAKQAIEGSFNEIESELSKLAKGQRSWAKFIGLGAIGGGVAGTVGAWVKNRVSL